MYGGIELKCGTTIVDKTKSKQEFGASPATRRTLPASLIVPNCDLAESEDCMCESWNVRCGDRWASGFFMIVTQGKD